MMIETLAQTEVLRQHHMGQQVLAGVIKQMMAGQRQGQQLQQQGVTGTGPTVTEGDDNNGTDSNFPNGPSPHSGPPTNGPFCVVNEVPQIPSNMEIVRRL